MRPSEATIVDFHIYHDETRPRAQAIAYCRYNGNDRPQLTWISLTRQETQMLVQLADSIQNRVLQGQMEDQSLQPSHPAKTVARTS